MIYFLKMRIYRAHSYSSIEIIREEEKKLPIHIIKMIQPYQLIVLPESTPFYFTGIKAWQNREDANRYIGWCHYPQNTKLPHIFVTEGDERWIFIHEVGHAVDERLGFPSEKLFKPELALTDWGKRDSDEYFAEAFEQFFDPIKKEKLFKADKNIFYFIRAILNRI